MKNFTLCLQIVAAGLMPLLCSPVQAQQNKFISKELTKKIEADKRIEDYLELSKLGYSEKEIFEDLGNANFLAEKYATAAFWYQKLIDLVGTEEISKSYMERYQVAMHKAGIANFEKSVSQTDWYSDIRKEYQGGRDEMVAESTPSKKQNFQFKPVDPLQRERALESLHQLAGIDKEGSDIQGPEFRVPAKGYTPPVALSADGRTAYFSKAVYLKPEVGVFSKKEPVHKIYRTEYQNGQWINVTEVGIVPKYASALHPAISPDGQRLFFASDMPGTFGKYDIYVADIRKDGSFGVAKNLGEKVNTKKNEMYPNLVGDNLLFFASNGREGMGGLDLFAVQVETRKVGVAVNLGAPFNSSQDDFALSLKAEEGLAIIMSNRGALDAQVRQLVFSMKEEGQDRTTAKRKYDFMELLPMDPNSVYTNIYYED
ncbi:WD40-like Beta Propeller Repeat [Muriicola jejuensis]|uniref:Cell envelope biogenesis protein OmpA n=1 Tax=Muriicola jejuensis TaxID=504488 RepID=A0A6P0UE12_9FLAO|nr:PD40 domain-containing protein [Muriicola jejuensis]NER11455.1 cell envelope biogenesis protein OmpA [Muriicola jejuensis]SMP20699.1 WD40-like Beta Propeller Repeat [Muriicola jejuensis]